MPNMLLNPKITLHMRVVLPFVFIVSCCSCGIFKPSPKYQFSDGYYSARGIGGIEKVYVHNQEEQVKVYPVDKGTKRVDTLRQGAKVFGQDAPDSVKTTPVFSKNSFDIDFLTIPIKYRLPVNGGPQQLNANLNGGLYLGYRKDYYVIRYNVSPIGISKRTTTHLGFSVGGYVGLGNTFISQYVTSGAVQSEYDGVVLNRGFAAIAALNHFTAGVAIGWDKLLDHNHKFWIYNNKPWLGIVLGLNLN